MKIEKMIYDVIKSKIRQMKYNENALFDGIIAYAADNRIELLVEKMQAAGKNPAAAVEMFIKPITNLSPEAIIAYFVQYQPLKEFRQISNQIFEAVRHFHATKEVKVELVVLEDRLKALAAKLYYDPTLKNMLDMELSENMLDINYMRGETDKLSLRLGREVRHFAE